MTGGAAFNEVFLEGARIPDDNRLGPEGGGWGVAVTTLLHERLQLGLGLARVGGGVDRLLAELRPRGVADDPVVRQLAAQLAIDARGAQYLGWRIVSKLAEGQIPGAEGAVAKLASSRVSRRYDELAEAMRGAASMVHDEYTLLQLWVPATRLAGGTDEVLKNVIAERVLGLPAEPRVDKDVPFRDVPRDAG
jgi:alkylation response protein AidB-like acyl-CoA dehydrogenase